MRLNLPVSNVEFLLPDGVVIVSKTNLMGTITYCNQAFTEVCGYSREEVVGSPHNIVRHPEMPSEVFADLWKTIRANKPWQGIVKNRRRDGSFYWAVSHVTPLLEKGEATGYVSFRYKATRGQIEYASDAYRKIREGSSRLRIEEGNIIEVKNPLARRLNALGIKCRLLALILFLLGTLVAVGIFNLHEASDIHGRAVDGLANASRELSALEVARSADAAFREQRNAWKNILIRGRDADSLSLYLKEFDQRGKEVERILTEQLRPAMRQIGLPVDEVDALLGAHSLMTNKCHSALRLSDVRNPANVPAVDALSKGVDERMAGQFASIISTIGESQRSRLSSLKETLETSGDSHSNRAIGVLAAVAAAAFLLSVWFLGAILRPARRCAGNLDRVVQLQQQFFEKILALEEHQEHLDEEQRIGSHIMRHITNPHGEDELDPLVRHFIRPAEHLSGDILLAARTPDNVLHILLADAVGHGLAAAVNVLPLSQAFYAMSEKGFRIAQIAEELNLKINRLMPPDRFVAATLISVNMRDRVVEIWNGGNPAPFLVNKKGEVMRRWESVSLPLGILSSERFSGRPLAFHYGENCQLCVFSDGLPEAESPSGEPFGEDRVRRLLQDSGPNDRLEDMVNLLELHLAGRPAHDDVSVAIIEIPICRRAEAIPAVPPPLRAIPECGGEWKIEVNLGAAELKYLNIVPMLTAVIEKIHIANEFASPLFMILSELFNNALDHGVLQLDSGIKHGADGFDKFLQLREERLLTLEDGAIDLSIERVAIEGRYGVKIRIVGSGGGFDHAAILEGGNHAKHGQHGRGIALVESIAYKLEYEGKGNEVTAYYLCA